MAVAWVHVWAAALAAALEGGWAEASVVPLEMALAEARVRPSVWTRDVR